ncbi:MAG: hypothetical protein K9L24_01940 [Spirochaetia bacterium]|nr:hypothetical protein [Spirochaetia bacterium]MCF7946738.1 hypothetical protein [Spirochaetia bacterium]MCF7952451.1 hypothetical protein [Spirochaetales bacterium]
MIKKTFLMIIFLSILPIFCLFSEDTIDENNELSTNENNSFILSLYSHDIDGMFLRNFHIGISPAARFKGKAEFSIPINFFIHSGEEIWILDFSGKIKFFPKSANWWFGLTLLQNIIMYGENKPDNSSCYMTEISSGYSIHVNKRFLIEPYFLLRNPFNRNADDLERIASYSPSFAQFEFGLSLRLEILNW